MDPTSHQQQQINVGSTCNHLYQYLLKTKYLSKIPNADFRYQRTADTFVARQSSIYKPARHMFGSLNMVVVVINHSGNLYWYHDRHLDFRDPCLLGSCFDHNFLFFVFSFDSCMLDMDGVTYEEDNPNGNNEISNGTSTSGMM